MFRTRRSSLRDTTWTEEQIHYLIARGMPTSSSRLGAAADDAAAAPVVGTFVKHATRLQLRGKERWDGIQHGTIILCPIILSTERCKLGLQNGDTWAVQITNPCARHRHGANEYMNTNLKVRNLLLQTGTHSRKGYCTNAHCSNHPHVCCTNRRNTLPIKSAVHSRNQPPYTENQKEKQK